MLRKRLTLWWFLCFVTAGTGSVLAVARFASGAEKPYYEGKTITIIQATNPGGTGDLRRKALAPYLQKYIPGNPTVLFEYMPGGGGRKAGNYIYRSARPDGLTIGGFSNTLISAALLGAAGVQYDIDRLIYLGTPT